VAPRRIDDDSIREAIESYDPRLSTMQAYLAQVRERLLAARNWRFDQPETVYPHIKAANLPRKTEFEHALATAWARSPFLRNQAYDQFVWEQFLSEGHLDIASTNTYAAIIADLGKKQGWTLNAQSSDAAERARLIASITQGRDTFQVYGGRPGEAKRLMELQSSELDSSNVTIEKLRELDAAAADVRRKRGMDRHEQRADLQQRSDEARGTRIFRPGDRTELDVEVRYKDGAGNALEIVGDGPKSKPPAGPTMDRSVPIADSAKQIFLSPATGRFYSRAELYKLSDTNRALFKTLMRTDNNLLNELLAQAN